VGGATEHWKRPSGVLQPLPGRASNGAEPFFAFRCGEGFELGASRSQLCIGRLPGTVDLHHLSTSRADDAGLYAPLGHYFHSHQPVLPGFRSGLRRCRWHAGLVGARRHRLCDKLFCVHGLAAGGGSGSGTLSGKAVAGIRCSANLRLLYALRGGSVGATSRCRCQGSPLQGARHSSRLVDRQRHACSCPATEQRCWCPNVARAVPGQGFPRVAWEHRGRSPFFRSRPDALCRRLGWPIGGSRH